MIKTYKAKGYCEYALQIKIDGRTKLISFNGNRVAFSGCFCTTKDKSIQDAIENTKAFKNGSVIVIEESKTEDDNVIIKEEIPTVSDEKELVTRKVKSIQSAANILATEYGVDINTLDSVEAVLSAAENVGVKFPNLQ